MKKIGELVCVRSDAGEMHSDNRDYEGQLGVIVEYGDSNDYPYVVKFLSTGESFVFNDDELEEAPDGSEQA